MEIPDIAGLGNIATEVLLYQIWCASETCTGLKFSAFYYKSVFTSGTGITRNGQIIDKWLKFIISQYYDGCMLKIEFKRAIFH